MVVVVIIIFISALLSYAIVAGFGKRVNSWSMLVRLTYRTLYKTFTRMTLWHIIMHALMIVVLC